MPPIIHVVAGIVFNAQGEILLSSRPKGKEYAGYWEFAGGKIEPNETPLSALQREFKEELDINILNATPWLAKFYQYPHAHVHLRFFRITAHQWRGKPTAKEQQQFIWQHPSNLTVSPMLPANTALLHALTFPTISSCRPCRCDNLACNPCRTGHRSFAAFANRCTHSDCYCNHI